MIGTMLGPYRVLEKLGEGGMGEVYKARDTRLDRTVAIKILPPAVAADPERRARFEREAKTIAGLNHPHICTLHDVGDHNGSMFLVMEHVAGETLAERLRKGPLPLDQALGIAADVADALSAAHRQGVIHRDLKPGNVMLTKTGAKLLDFGLAKLTGHGEQPAATHLASAPTRSVPLTGEGVIVGTLQYMAPEQLAGKPPDARTDLWALGALLYEMVTGKRAFEGESHASVISAIMSAEPAPIPTIQPTTPPGVDRLVRQCLAKASDDRPDTAHDVASDLRWLWETSGARAATSAQVSHAVHPVRARRAWLAIAASVVVVAVGLVAVNGGGLRDRLLGTGRAPTVRSLAVLPFENRTGDAAQDYLVEGIHEALIIEMSQIGSLQVKARPVVMRYRKNDKPLSQIARELSVDAVVTGSVLRAGDTVQVTAELVHGATEANLWANRYSRDLRSVPILLGDVSRDIATEIRIALTPEQRERLARTRTVNPEAYEAYLKARYLLNQMTPGWRLKVPELFQRAIDLDPTFASAYSGLATARGLASILGGDRPRANAPEVLAAVRRALELDPTQAEAHAILGTHRLYYQWDWSGAESELRRALELNPGNAFVYHPYADFLLVCNRLAESLDYVRRGRDIDPLSSLVVLPVAGHLTFLDRYDDAIQESRKFLDIQPNAPWARSLIESALWYKGEEEQSFQMLRVETQDKQLLALLDRGHASGGPRGAMRALADALVARSQSEYVSPLAIAHNYAAGGRADSAFEWLEKAYEERTPFLLHIRFDPDFKPLRSDPRFADLVRRIGFPQ